MSGGLNPIVIALVEGKIDELQEELAKQELILRVLKREEK